MLMTSVHTLQLAKLLTVCGDYVYKYHTHPILPYATCTYQYEKWYEEKKCTQNGGLGEGKFIKMRVVKGQLQGGREEGVISILYRHHHRCSLTPSSGRRLKKSRMHQQPWLVFSMPTLISIVGRTIIRGITLQNWMNNDTPSVDSYVNA